MDAASAAPEDKCAAELGVGSNQSAIKDSDANHVPAIATHQYWWVLFVGDFAVAEVIVVRPNVEVTGAAPLFGAASGGPQG